MPFFLKKYEKTFILTFLALLKCAHRFVDVGCWVWLLGGCEYGVGANMVWERNIDGRWWRVLEVCGKMCIFVG